MKRMMRVATSLVFTFAVVTTALPPNVWALPDQPFFALTGTQDGYDPASTRRSGGGYSGRRTTDGYRVVNGYPDWGKDPFDQYRYNKAVKRGEKPVLYTTTQEYRRIRMRGGRNGYIVDLPAGELMVIRKDRGEWILWYDPRCGNEIEDRIPVDYRPPEPEVRTVREYVEKTVPCPVSQSVTNTCSPVINITERQLPPPPPPPLPAIGGVCGPANMGIFESPGPTAGLCASGTPSALMWNGNSIGWTCTGSNGGGSSTCLAGLKAKDKPCFGWDTAAAGLGSAGIGAAPGLLSRTSSTLQTWGKWSLIGGAALFIASFFGDSDKECKAAAATIGGVGGLVAGYTIPDPKRRHREDHRGPSPEPPNGPSNPPPAGPADPYPPPPPPSGPANPPPPPPPPFQYPGISVPVNGPPVGSQPTYQPGYTYQPGGYTGGGSFSSGGFMVQ